MVPVSAARALAVSAGFAVAACRSPAPTARERVLAGLPGDAVAVIAADGRALSHPRIRALLDVAAARWPASLGCVVDAAVASDAIGLTVDRAGNIAVLAALPRPPRCPALSQREPGLWIATLGAGPAAPVSALDDPRLARARPYLTGSPIAAAVLGDVHLLAAAKPDPLDAWLAIDAPGGAGAGAIAEAVAAQIARLEREPSTAALAARLRVSRPSPSQLVVRLAGATGATPGTTSDGELAAALRTGLLWLDAEAAPRAPAAAAFACPAPAGGVTCSGGRSFRVGSLAADLAPIVGAGRPAPIVVNGSVTGLRLAAAVGALGLEPGDVVVAMAGRLVTSRKLLADWIAHARGATSLTIRRGAAETVLQFAEPGEPSE